jgi:3-mercaptopyruvate sulfurtransferase SseA
MTAPEFNFGLLIEAEDLVPYLGNEHLRIVDLSRSSVYEQLHIPHAIQLKPKQLVAQHEDATGVLPSIEQLQQLVEYLNLSPDHHVVVYDDEGGMGRASDLEFTLSRFHPNQFIKWRDSCMVGCWVSNHFRDRTDSAC